MAKFGKDAPNLRDLKRRREVIGVLCRCTVYSLVIETASYQTKRHANALSRDFEVELALSAATRLIFSVVNPLTEVHGAALSIAA